MIPLNDKWGPMLVAQGETGMGYQVASIVLKDGRRFDRVVIVGRYITQIKDIDGIPFSEDQIDQIIVTHDKWDFSKESHSR
jgi:hypothetical protein